MSSSDRALGWVRRADDALYSAERAFVVASMASMVVMVFFDVVDRRLEAPESKLAALILALVRLVRLEPGGAAFPAFVQARLAPAVGLAVVFGLLWFAQATMRRRGASRTPPRLEPVLALLGAAVIFGLGAVMLHRPSNQLYALVWIAVGIAIGFRLLRERRGTGALIAVGLAIPLGTLALYRFVPEGYSWAKEVAMILLVWTGFVGSSMAAHDGRHIDIDFGKKIFPASLRKAITLLAHLLNAGFCAFIVLIGLIYVFGPSGLYRLEGRFPHTGIPDWIVAVSIPVTFTLIAFRTLVVVVKVARGDLAAKGSGDTPPPSLVGGHGAPAAEEAP